MPNYKTHFAAGLAFYILVVLTSANSINLKDGVIYLAIALTYSLLPDIDSKNSKINLIIKNVLIAISLILVAIGLIFSYTNYIIAGIVTLIIVLVMNFTRHRGLIHTIRAGLIAAIPILVIGIPETVFALGNFFIHLLLDNDVKL